MASSSAKRGSGEAGKKRTMKNAKRAAEGTGER
jgi:hypothetical protein